MSDLEKKKQSEEEEQLEEGQEQSEEEEQLEKGQEQSDHLEATKSNEGLVEITENLQERHNLILELEERNYSNRVSSGIDTEKTSLPRPITFFVPDQNANHNVITENNAGNPNVRIFNILKD